MEMHLLNTELLILITVASLIIGFVIGILFCEFNVLKDLENQDKEDKDGNQSTAD